MRPSSARPSSLVWRAHVLTTTEEEEEEEGPLLEITAFESKAHAKNDYFHVGKRGEMAARARPPAARAGLQEMPAAAGDRKGGPRMYGRLGRGGGGLKRQATMRRRGGMHL